MSYDILRQPGRIITFDTRPTSILPMRYTNVEVVGIVGYSIALSIEDINAKYQQILPFLPDVSKDFSRAEYAIIKHNGGDLEVLALAWIEESTIQTTSVVTKKITLFNVHSAVDQQLVKMLRLNGFTDYMIEDA